MSIPRSEDLFLEPLADNKRNSVMEAIRFTQEEYLMGDVSGNTLAIMHLLRDKYELEHALRKRDDTIEVMDRRYKDLENGLGEFRDSLAVAETDAHRWQTSYEHVDHDNYRLR